VPTYEYTCKECGEHHEVHQKFSDPSLTECPSCGGPLRKVFGNIAIAFKGSGFYKNDSRSSKGKRDAKKDTESKGESTSAGSPAGAAAASSPSSTPSPSDGGGSSSPSSSPTSSDGGAKSSGPSSTKTAAAS